MKRMYSFGWKNSHKETTWGTYA